MNTDLLKLTPWYPVSVFPVRVGVYKVRRKGHFGVASGMFAYWDGRRFNKVLASGNAAKSATGGSWWMEIPDAEWCGLVEQPK